MQVTFVKGKVDEPEFVAAVVGAAPDAVIHLAGLQVPTCRDNPVLGARVNVIGTLNVFEAAKALKAAGGVVPKIVYASSAAVFGPDAEYGEEAAGDMSTPKPTSHYGAYKLCCEFAAKAYALSNGIASVGLRPLTVYGPGRDQGLTSFPSRSIAAAVLGQKFEIPFSGATVYIHIREIADIFVQTARNRDVADAKVYTIGGDTVDTATFVSELDKVRDRCRGRRDGRRYGPAARKAEWGAHLHALTHGGPSFFLRPRSLPVRRSSPALRASSPSPAGRSPSRPSWTTLRCGRTTPASPAFPSPLGSARPSRCTATSQRRGG